MEKHGNDEAIAEFLAESEEILARVSANLLRLQKGECTSENLDELYRDMHTLKGSAQLFGYNSIGIVAHAIETCLDPIRKFRIVPKQRLLDTLFKCIDLIEDLVKKIHAKSGDDDATDRITEILPKLIENACKQFGSEFNLVKDIVMPQETFKTYPAVEKKGIDQAEKPKERGENKMNSNGGHVEAEKKQHPEVTSPTATSETNGAADTSIRVQVGLLDNLMNLIGEMVLVRNQVLQYSNRSEDLEFLNLSQRLDLVTSDLQDQVMKTRMQPIGNVISKFQRLIRDLANDLGKQIDLTIQGKDTDLDKTLLEAIKDPLTHIVRNSCDHGIENPKDRVQAGKPATGHVLISAFHEGGQVIIEISDDGKGLSRKKIVEKAISKGLISQEKAETLTDRDMLNIIFLPGFSTADQVSSLSGRGVGMDVVRTNIEKIGGSVDLESIEGKGTTIRLRIPLTLAIVPAMLIKSRNATYAIPQVKLVELVRVENQGDSEDNFQKIQLLQGKPVYELRGKFLPLVDLRQVLSPGTSEHNAQFDLSKPTINIVVLSSDGEPFGLIVDEVMDTADIVVKPLSKFLKSLEIYSAATILGTGEVALIIDPIGIAKSVHLSVSGKRQEGAFSEHEESNKTSSDQLEYLLFTTDAEGKYAVPLCMVSRLEEIPTSQIEYSGKQPIIQYRNEILPLVDINASLGYSSEFSQKREKMSIIVVNKSGRLFGVVVSSILDVMISFVPIDDSVKDREGIVGNFIHGNEVITVIDIIRIIEKKLEHFSDGTLKQSVAVESNVINGTVKILYVEDVAFFRKQVSKLLSGKGFEVTTAINGEEALNLLKSGDSPDFELVLSDIEMPKLNGYEFVKNAKRIEKFKSVPFVALTTRFNQKDIDEGIQSGFDCYLEKLNPEKLLAQLQTILSSRTTDHNSKNVSSGESRLIA
jgi:two-component system chemotaxis sensor kinase CheA